MTVWVTFTHLCLKFVMAGGIKIQIYVTGHHDKLISVRKAIPDWRGRCHRKPSFTERLCCAEDLQSIDAPLLHCQEVPGTENNIIKDVRGAYFPTCLVEELYGAAFFYTHCSMQCFLSQSIRDMIRLDGDMQKIDGDSARTSKKLECFRQNRAVLQKTVYAEVQ